jgi:hypothetical protein
MLSMFRLSGSAPACSGSESTQDLPFSAQIKAAAAPLGDQNKIDDKKLVLVSGYFEKTSLCTDTIPQVGSAISTDLRMFLSQKYCGGVIMNREE